MTVRILVGDALAQLRTLPDQSVQCCVTSPPYWGLRDYGHAGQLGLERTPDEYVAGMVAVFREVNRVLRDDGTLWLNIGDSYATTPPGCKGVSQSSGLNGAKGNTAYRRTLEQSVGAKRNTIAPGLKPKDLVGIPWMLAFALRAEGWYLRSDIIWAKPNPMPESVTDRPTKAHEYVFLLSKSERYFYDADAIAEPFADSSLERLRQDIAGQRGSDRVPGKTNGPMKAVGLNAGRSSYRAGSASNMNDGDHVAKSDAGLPVRDTGRNKRTVWTIPTALFNEAHFATMPPDLAETCILAGSSRDACHVCRAPVAPDGATCECEAGGYVPGVVLDPFGGAGTTGLVADRMGRDAILCELNPEYATMAERRIKNDNPMFTEVEVA